MTFADLRAFLAELEARGELARIREPVDPRFGISAWIRRTSDVGGPALLFEQVKGSAMQVVGGVFASPSKAIIGLGARDHADALDRMTQALEHPIPAVVEGEAVCQEIVLTGDDVDLTRLPIPTYSEQDGGAYVTVGIGVCRTLDHGTLNAGVYRMQVFGPREIGLEVSPYSDAHHVISAHESAGRDMDFAVALGVEPAIFLGTQARVPYGVDEFGVAGGLRGEAVRLARCCTVDLEVPATSEIVLEGRIRPGRRDPEGPFGEFTGYVGPAGFQPVVELTALTMRRDAIFQAGLTGIPVTENHVLKGLPLEAELLKHLRATYPDVTAVAVPAEGASEFLVVVSLRQRYAYEARNVILAAMASVGHPKIVVAVDDDVDVYDMAKVWWAIATRCQPADDLIVIDRAAGGQLDPSAPEAFASSLLGIDATRPFGQPFPEVVRIPGVDALPDPRTLVSRRPT